MVPPSSRCETPLLRRCAMAAIIGCEMLADAAAAVSSAGGAAAAAADDDDDDDDDDNDDDEAGSATTFDDTRTPRRLKISCSASAHPVASGISSTENLYVHSLLLLLLWSFLVPAPPPLPPLPPPLHVTLRRAPLWDTSRCTAALPLAAPPPPLLLLLSLKSAGLRPRSSPLTFIEGSARYTRRGVSVSTRNRV